MKNARERGMDLWSKSIAIALFSTTMLFFLPLIYHFGVALQPEIKEAVKGRVFIDEADFSQRDMIALGGEWAFFWQQFLSPSDIISSKQQAAYINGAGGWQAGQEHEAYNAVGYGTYHLNVDLTDAGMSQHLAIRIPHIETAYRFYIDEVLVASSGQVSQAEASASPAYASPIILLSPDKKVFTLTIQVSNFHSSWGGIWSPVVIGELDSIHQLKRDKVALSMFILGALLISAVHSMIQFYMRPSDKIPLVFSCLCLTLFLREFSLEHMYLALSSMGVGFTVFVKLNYLTFYAGLPISIYFVHLCYYKEFNNNVTRVFYATAILFSLYVLLTPTRYIGYSFAIFQFIAFAIIVYSLSRVFIAATKQYVGASLMLLGCLIAAIFVVNDLLNASGVISTGRFFSLGIVGFIVCQSLVTNNRFNHLITRNEILTGELKERNSDLELMSEQLETKVEQRTQQLKLANKELNALANVDQLTNALNRHGLQQYIQTAFERYRRTTEPFSLILLDYDHFKAVNDTYGHDIGDIVLVSGADIVKRNIREQDKLARWGGEEFLILLPNTALKGAEAIGNKLREAIYEHVIGQPEGVRVSVTGGVAQVQQHDTFESLFKRTDSALYNGKRAGRNRIHS